MNEVLASIGAAFCLFLLVLIKSKSKSALGDLWLVAWLAVHAVWFIALGLTAVLPPELVRVAVLASQLAYLSLPPLQYFHARASSNYSVRDVAWEASFSALIFGGLLALPLLFESTIVAGSLTVMNASLIAVPLIVLLVCAYYPIRAWLHLGRHRSALKQRLSNLHKADIEWGRRWAISTLLVQGTGIAVYFATFLFTFPIPARMAVLLFFQAVAIGIVGYLGLTSSRVFLLNRGADELGLPDDRQDYDEAAVDFRAVQAFVAKEKSFLDPELTALALADAIGWAPDRLSRALRLGGGTNFYDFVNRARVDTLKALARDPQNRRTNMLFLAYDSGFGSKSAFYEAFRAVESIPPAQWRKQELAKSA